MGKASPIIKRYSNVKHGVEGPEHDPYAFTEHTMYQEFTNGTKVEICLHLGLVSYLDVNETRVDVDDSMDFKYFIRCVEQAKFRRRTRCPCGSRHITWRQGYPGEDLYLCDDCGALVDSEFGLSAVI